MNQTRTFLIFAWLMVATLLWMEWGKERREPATATATEQPAQGAVPAAGKPTSSATIPSAPTTTATPPTPTSPSVSATPADNASAVTITTDVLRLTIDGGSVTHAALLRFPQTRDNGSPPVTLFDANPARFYAAQSGWVSQSNPAPTHERGFVPAGTQTEVALASGQKQLVVPFVWRGPDGVSIRRDYIVTRGSYAVEVKDTVVNTGDKPWQGFVYRQLIRVPPVVKSGITNPEAFSLSGAAWHSSEGGYERRPFADFIDDGPLSRDSRGGWIALLQHHFFSAWIPERGATNTVALDTDSGAGAPRHFIRELGPQLDVAPGKQASTSAKLWVGPKLVDQIKAQGVAGLDRAVDYSRFALFAVLGEGLFWILDQLHKLFGNWGWSIIGLVVLVKLALYPLSKAQYQSMAKMRRFQPRIAQLKERYGDDKQKFQVAMMELYKKEKINPVGGCLPILLQMPIFLALYYVLLESVELRQAPWILWIQDLTARDPYFILPLINIAVMWSTQRLTPMVGMDPMQKKMMQIMPLVFGVMFAFFPAGLVLYWVTNGALGLLQQWWLIRKYSEQPAKA